jgi:MFS family permease
VGYLYSALGLGALLGGVVAALIGGTVRLDHLLAGSVVLSGVTLALFGLSSVAVAALLFILLVGLAETLEYAAYETLLQQAVPENAIGRASGTMDSFLFNSMLIGNLISGLLAAWIGLTVSIFGLGIVTALGAVAAYLNLRLKSAGQPDAALLAEVPAFAHVPVAVREWATRRMLREQFPPGAVVIRQGDEGDKFYTIARGVAQVEVMAEGEVMTRELGPGTFFGEIALLRNVPRTATVRALKPLTVYALSREDFHELQERASEFTESLLETVSARLAEESSFKLALAMRT